MMKQLGVPFEMKELSDTGSFEGLASVYGNVDLGGDVILPGAFKEFNLTKDGHVIILDAHNTRAPIGKGKLTDTHLGLAMRGQLNLKVSRARDVHELMKDGIISGLSIGYDVLPNGAKFDEASGTRILEAIKLWEVSAVAFPMNQEAQVSAVKEIQRCTSVRDVEDLLREATGLSRTQAKLHASAIWKTLSGTRDAETTEAQDGAQKLLEVIGRFSKPHKE